MSEIPAGMELMDSMRKPPRPTVTIMLTKSGSNGPKVLLGKREETMPSFPGYWAFPGGGVSKIDNEAAETLGIENRLAALFREMVEELGFTIENGKIKPVPDSIQARVLTEKSAWFELAQSSALPFSEDGIRLISERTTPPFGPHRFANAFFHFHCVEEPPQISLTQQTEFSEVQWIEPRNLLQQWKKHDIKVAPPVVTLLMEVERCLNLMEGDMERVAVDLEKRKPGRRSILFAHGVEVIPVPTATLPPADHTNAYLIGEKRGPCLLIDPACRARESMEVLAESVERHEGELIGILFTHRHADHLGDIGLLKEGFDVPIWGSKITSESIPCDRILEDGELIVLGEQTWEVLITPGHCPGHVCLISDAGLVAGDMVAGIGTILVPPHEGDMHEYIRQLERLKNKEPHLIFPSHGPVIPLPQKMLNHYISHRKRREGRILDALVSSSNIEEIARMAYDDTPKAHPFLAKDQTLAHLISLQKTHQVTHDENGWRLV